MEEYYIKTDGKFYPHLKVDGEPTHVMITVDELKKYKESLAKLEDTRSLYAHFIKIMKEKSNSDRSLHPKKEHSGYVYQYTSEERYRYKLDGRWNEIEMFKSSFQTPYSIDIDYYEAFNLIIEDMLGDKRLALQIGITESECLTVYEELHEKFKEIKERIYRLSDGGFEEVKKEQQKLLDSNFIVSPCLRANGSSEYWEFVFKHRYPLKTIPWKMRIARRKRTKKNGLAENKTGN